MQTAACLYSSSVFGSIRCETTGSPTCAAFVSIYNVSSLSISLLSK